MATITVRIPKPYSDCRTFIVDELTEFIYERSMKAKLGGATVMKLIGDSRATHHKVIQDSPTEATITVFLGKPSNSLRHGYVRALVEARAEEDSTVIELSETRKGCFFLGLRLVAWAFFLLPGILLLFHDAMWSRHHRKILREAASEVRRRYPEAEIYE